MGHRPARSHDRQSPFLIEGAQRLCRYKNAPQNNNQNRWGRPGIVRPEPHERRIHRGFPGPDPLLPLPPCQLLHRQCPGNIPRRKSGNELGQEAISKPVQVPCRQQPPEPSAAHHIAIPQERKTVRFKPASLCAQSTRIPGDLFGNLQTIAERPKWSGLGQFLLGRNIHVAPSLFGFAKP